MPEARTLLGPVVPGAHGGAHGVHVPGTSFVLDPVAAAFSTGALVSWLDYNDCWLGAEWCGRCTSARTPLLPDPSRLTGYTRLTRSAPSWPWPSTRPACAEAGASRRC